MRQADTRNAEGRLAVVWLVAMALLVRSLVPAGYMLAPDHSTHFWPVVLCSGSGPAELTAPTTSADAHGDAAHHAGEGHHKQDGGAPGSDHQREQPCAFSGLGTLAAPSDLSPSAPWARVLAGVILPPALMATVGQGLAAPPPPATGPPASL